MAALLGYHYSGKTQMLGCVSVDDQVDILK